MIKKLFIALILFFSSSFVSVQALNDCPFGEKHDSCKYPGKCGGYADTDKNDTCDHSQSVFEINHDQEIKEEKISVEANTTLTKSTDKKRRVYHLVPITSFLLGLYVIMQFLLKKKIIKLLTFRKIWNSLLLVSFLVSGILGILLIIKINFGLEYTLLFDIMFWHVEAGIALFVMCVLHIIERRHFFLNMFK